MAHVNALRARYLREKEAEESKKARREQDIRERQERARTREDYGHFGSPNRGKRANEYTIHAHNRKGKDIAHATAKGRPGVRRARRAILQDKRTWVKFQTYNQTRKKFVG